ncbi:hypothetical protein QAD02_021504 [Eretmocerus hayati]|uniref:Uncharacterized protein n=1 Tax=Eretmocerus hayati TaxID=131215 RepID=A0ACC2PRW7_9HYME|nr:hypothetical protein QAD02_021504 [Eretmocerus hayati]
MAANIVPQWDGVMPQNHPEVYGDMLMFSCVIKNPNVEQYYVSYWTGIMECESCFRRDHFRISEPVARVMHPHMIVPRDSIYTECEQCNLQILVERPIINCGMCTDQYFATELLAEIRVRQELHDPRLQRIENDDDSDIEILDEDPNIEIENERPRPDERAIGTTPEPRYRFREEMERNNQNYERN